MRKIRFGIIGTGKIVHNFLDAALKHKEFELTSVYSRDINKAKEFGKPYGAKNFFDDLEEFSKCNEIDAVYIASPNFLHESQSILCMNNKKHVLCEKPMASNSKEVSRMIKASKDNGVLLMEAMRLTVLPNFLKVKENLNKIGKIRRYFASYCQYSSRYDSFKEGVVLNAFNKDFSNGALMDIGVYCIHPMINLFGKPNKVISNSVFLSNGIDGEGSVIFNYDDFDGIIMYSKISNSNLPLEIQGEDGSMLISNIHFEDVKIIYRDGREEKISIEPLKNDMYYEIDEFIRCIKNGQLESKLNSLSNSLSAIELMDEIRKEIGLKFPADK
ncbi:Gfo/Idh/MocA family oxidoreductase [Clostridium baratii]|uniref:Gfo/Idh/MocA family protein n=1 Tax=Clostridium baratii TaxID=1561 RepID=UPI0005F2CD78|nr:Gfo/Idh/MocA family oxidoreductase [Clostridium baratii]KJU73184.1 oxidoreductase [Clostridium baratii]MDU1855419.1 Gfo/Idh/MocA family oxidoreductase [Clostridium baratii]